MGRRSAYYRWIAEIPRLNLFKFMELFSFSEQWALRAIVTQAQFSSHRVLELRRRHYGIAIAFGKFIWKLRHFSTAEGHAD